MAHTKATETTGHLWIEEGEPQRGLIAQVALIVPVRRTYAYAVPAPLAEQIHVGHRVAVRLGRRGRVVEGFVVGLDHGVWESTLRPIDSVVDRESFLTPELVDLGREISTHYACPLGQTLKAMTPESVRQGRGLQTVRYARLMRPIREILDASARVSPKRRAVIETLAGAEAPLPVVQLLEQAHASVAILRATVAAGWVEIETRKQLPQSHPTKSAGEPPQEPGFVLKSEQQAALDAICTEIDAKRFSVTLLFGVSGGGKTEVYIRAMQHVLRQGRQVLLLVPEIMLTTQLVQRLARRFPDAAVMHSGLTEARRSLAWQRVALGQNAVVIGTRSAVFAPFPHLGLICVDEEQETSYKNLQAPRYHTRDVAILRAWKLGIPVVLGSATPSVETWHHSGRHRDYRRVVIRKRINERPMPRIHIVDMHEETLEQKRSVVMSRLMEHLLRETLNRHEQAVLLINRRGFAQRLYCPSCRMRIICPHCSVGLVVHRSEGQCLCHYCRTRIPIPDVCPNVTCGGKLIQVGLGTERVEEVVTRCFPQARVQRVDRDTMRHRSRYGQILEEFEARRIDVLVGTQMIAKGLDFPFVSFVGVMDADTAALGADFRSHERLFQLITQVAGRAGRGNTPGEVVVQTHSPALPALRFALQHDYESFVNAELPMRETIGFPPFRRLARIELAHAREEIARKEAETLSDRIDAVIQAMSLEHADVLGPNPCFLPRLRGRYRYDMLVRARDASDLRSLLARLEAEGALRTKVKSMIVDVDPVALS